MAGQSNLYNSRYELWLNKMTFPEKPVSKLKSLPPTTNAFLEHLYRAYCQTMVWKSASSRGLPALDPAHYLL